MAASCRLNIVFDIVVVERKRNKVCKNVVCKSIPSSLAGISVIDSCAEVVNFAIRDGHSCRRSQNYLNNEKQKKTKKPIKIDVIPCVMI